MEEVGMVIKGIGGLLVGYVLLMLRLLHVKVNDTMSKDEVSELIDLKIDVLEETNKSIHRRLAGVEQKLDRIIDFQIRNGPGK